MSGDLQKLLGGYATGTLTAEERKALFEAALNDQELFDALAREQALRDLLRDPSARAHLLAALDDRPARRWMGWWRPAAVAMAVIVVVGAGMVSLRHTHPAPRLAMIAQVQPPPPPETAPATEELKKEPASARPARKSLLKIKVAAIEVATLRAKAERAKQAEAEARNGPASVGSVAETVEVPDAAPAVRPAAPAPQPAVPPTLTYRQQFFNPTGAEAVALFFGGSAGSQLPTGSSSQGFGAGAVGGVSQEKQQTQRAAEARAVQSVAGTAYGTPPANLGVQYRVLRRLPTGEFVDVKPDEDVEKGATVKLEITPNRAGMVVIEGRDGANDAWHSVALNRVEQMQPFQTQPVPIDRAGVKEFRVSFSRGAEIALRGATAMFGPAPPGEDLVRATTYAASEPPPAGLAHASYVASRNPAAQQVTFTITVNSR